MTAEGISSCNLKFRHFYKIATRNSNPKTATQKQQPKNSNPKTATQKQQPKNSNPKTATQKQQLKNRNPKTETRNSNLKPRHSRAGGNLVCSVSVISDKFLLLFISRFPLSWEWRFSCYGYCQVSVMLEFRETYESSFPRRRESSLFGFSYFR